MRTIGRFSLIAFVALASLLMPTPKAWAQG